MADTGGHSDSLTLAELQTLIRQMFAHKDEARGVEANFLWLMEEVGELAAALREGSPKELEREFADVLAWLATLANLAGVDLQRAVVEKYGSGCPACGETVCACDESVKP